MSTEILITGYAKLPEGIPAKEMYGIIVAALIIDKKSGRIIDAESSLVTKVASDFVRDLLVGKNIQNMEEIEQVFNEKYYGLAKKAILSSVRTCHEKFNQIKA